MEDNSLYKTDSFETIISSCFLILFTIAVLIQISVRLLGVSISITEELARYFLVYMVYIGMAGAVTTNSHIAILLFEKQLNPKILFIREIIITTVSILMFIILIYSGTILTYNSWKSGITWTSIPQLSYAFIHMAIVLGSLLAIIRLVQTMIKKIRILNNRSKINNDQKNKNDTIDDNQY